MNIESLKAKWVELTNDPEYFDEIVKAYGAEGRYYHSLTHIEYMLNESVKIKDNLNNPLAVGYAIFFHDFVYVFGKDDNERQSASVAYTYIIDRTNLGIDFANEVYKLIMDTRHVDVPETNDGKYMVDMDLAALGEHISVFTVNQENVRKEYAKFNDKEFYKANTNFFLGLLSKDYIYCTDVYREFYEERARTNIKNRIVFVIHSFF